MLLLYEVTATATTQRAALEMTLLRKIRSTRTSQARTRRDVGRALRLAPTRASREELLLLLNR
ncbi:MAG: hypothetical protein JWN88_884 [Frankiales bacterium]|jgi:hypothetical protein|nr:hypothetical protein [Frankiales bacterium]